MSDRTGDDLLMRALDPDRIVYVGLGYARHAYDPGYNDTACGAIASFRTRTGFNPRLSGYLPYRDSVVTCGSCRRVLDLGQKE